MIISQTGTTMLSGRFPTRLGGINAPQTNGKSALAATSVREEILVICHGGPVSEPGDVRYVLERARGIVGFFDASSLERLPTERAITGQALEFKNLALELRPDE